MKNLILSIVFIFASITSFAQKKSEVGQMATDAGSSVKEGISAVHKDLKEAVPVVYNDVKSASGTLYSDAKKVIGELAAALKVGAEHVYIVLVKQQVVHSITNLIGYIACGLGIFFLFRAMDRGLKRIRKMNETISYKYDKKDISSDTWAFIGCFGGIILSIVTTVFFFGTIQETVTGFVNPEYGAITHIIDLINQARQ